MYKLISQTDIKQDDIVNTVLRNRGFNNEQIEKILSPSVDDVIHYSKLKNMDKAVQLFVQITKRESSELAIVVDSDP